MIKLLVKSDLVALSEKARALHLGVGRRSDWLTENVGDASRGTLWVILRESQPQPCYRCQIVIRRRATGSRTLCSISFPTTSSDYRTCHKNAYCNWPDGRWVTSRSARCQPSTWRNGRGPADLTAADRTAGRGSGRL